MAAIWQVQEATNRLGEVIDRAVSEGPQVITRDGRPVAKVVAVESSEEASGDDGLLQLLLNAPKSGLPEGLPRIPRKPSRRPPLFGEGD